MAAGDSTRRPGALSADNSADAQRDITRLANELEHTCDAMGRLASMAQDFNTPSSKPDLDLAATLWAVDKLALYSVGLCGAIARRVGGREVGGWEAELREIAPP